MSKAHIEKVVVQCVALATGQVMNKHGSKLVQPDQKFVYEGPIKNGKFPKWVRCVDEKFESKFSKLKKSEQDEYLRAESQGDSGLSDQELNAKANALLKAQLKEEAKAEIKAEMALERESMKAELLAELKADFAQPAAPVEPAAPAKSAKATKANKAEKPAENSIV